jgi:hypothetical protein
MRRGLARRFRRRRDSIPAERLPGNRHLRQRETPDESAFDRQYPGSQLCAGGGESGDRYHGPRADTAEALACAYSDRGNRRRLRVGSGALRPLQTSHRGSGRARGKHGRHPRKLRCCHRGWWSDDDRSGWRIWTEISQKFNLNFLALPEDLLEKLARDGEQERGMIPAGLYRGIERRSRPKCALAQ